MGKDVVSLIIFGVCVVLFIWNKLPAAVTALLGVCAMVLFGVIPFSTAFKNFGSSTIVLICAMQVVGQATFDTGLAQIVSKKILSVAKENERLIIIVATALTAVVSAFLSNIATLAIMISILTSICAGNKKIHFMNVILPVSMAAVIGGAATLVGSTTQLTGNALVEEYLGAGNGFSFSTFMIPGFIIIGLLVVYAGFVGYPLGKKIWGKREEYEESPVNKEEKEHKDHHLKTMGAIFIMTVLLLAFTDSIAKIIPNFNIAMAALICALACVLTGCITHKEAIKSVNWNLAVWFCASLGIAAGLSESGGGKMMAEWFVGLFGSSASPFVLFMAFVALTVIVTQFLSNSTVLAIVLPVCFSICQSYGYSIYSFAVGITIAGAMAVATPLANTTIGMSMVAKYKFSDYIKYAGPMTLIALLTIFLIVPLIYPLV